MKQFFIFITFFFAWLIAHGQNNAVAVEKSTALAGNYSFYAIDPFQYCYSVQTHVFRKTLDKEYFEYKNVTLGKITKVDIQNPLKLLLYYEDFNTVILLDNQLNETQKINFSIENTPINVTAIGIASLNQLWIYNNLNQQIGLYDYLKNTYKTVGTPLTAKIKHYTTDFNTFLWIDENNQGYSCSIFGNITSLGEFPICDQLQIISANTVLISQEEELFLLARQSDNSWIKTKIPIAEKRFQNFYYQGQNLTIFTNEGISNFKIILQ
jgi:hypothetical protein